MKTKLLSLLLTLSIVLCYGQFEVRQFSDDALITDGQVLNFSEAGCGINDNCNWKFKVVNTSTTDPLYMRIFVDNLTNTDGSNFQLCFAGVCLNDVTLNSGYPSTAATIPAGGASNFGNNLWNQNPPSTTTPMSWTFRYQPFDANNNPIGTPLTLTYNFNPNLGVDDFNISNVSIYPSIASTNVTINSQEDLSVRIYDILGKQVKEAKITTDNNTIDVSDLAPQMYILRLENNSGDRLIKKILVK